VLSQWLRGAGFSRVAYRNLSFGIVALHRGRKSAAPSTRASSKKRATS
jgi:demethylmenaquinone methyltransferase/2-methoxy-6-polyprenyl-1,4-benzoquinol methylase